MFILVYNALAEHFWPKNFIKAKFYFVAFWSVEGLPNCWKPFPCFHMYVVRVWMKSH